MTSLMGTGQEFLFSLKPGCQVTLRPGESPLLSIPLKELFQTEEHAGETGYFHLVTSVAKLGNDPSVL